MNDKIRIYINRMIVLVPRLATREGRFDCKSAWTAAVGILSNVLPLSSQNCKAFSQESCKIRKIILNIILKKS